MTEPKKRVLLIDDSQLALKKLQAILFQLNCEVNEAENGKSGLLLAERIQPDLIVLDVQMPEMDGIDTLKALRQNPKFKDTPVVMMTVQSDARTVAQALTGQIQDYILKDSDPKIIRERLSKYIQPQNPS